MPIKVLVLLGISSFLLADLVATAQDKVPPAYTDENNTAIDATGEKAGYFLEQEFSDYFKKCASKPMTTKDGVVLTSIPYPLVGSFDPWVWVSKPSGYSVANGFSIVVDGTDLAKAALPSYLPPSGRLPFDGLQDPSTMVPAGVSGFAYSANCSAIFA